jgi:LPXTG-motif cell wall-anchored protein
MKKSISRALVVSALVGVASLVIATPAIAAATVSPTTLVTGLYAGGSAYNPAGDTVVVAAGGQPNIAFPPVVDSEVDFIDVKTNTVTVVKDPAITAAISVVWSPDGATVYALNSDTDIAIIDVATHTVTGNLPSGSSAAPYGLAITPDGNYLVVGDYSSANASAIVEIATSTATTLNYTADYTVGVFVSGDGAKAYVVDYFGVVNVFDLTDPAYPLIDTMQFDGMSDPDHGGTSVCSSFDMSTLFMVDYNEPPYDATLSRLDLATGDSISTATKAAESIGCNMTPDGKNVLVASYGGDIPGLVLEFDAASLAFVAEYSTSATDFTDVIASSPKSCDVYVSNYEPSTNILNFPCNPALPNTGVDVVAMSAAGGLATVAVIAGVIVIAVRRRKA